MGIENPNYPLPGNKVRPNKRELDQIARKIRRDLMMGNGDMLSTSGGSVFIPEPAGDTGTAQLKWFRVITDDEVEAAGVGETTNKIYCRDALCSSGDDAPSVWAVICETNPDDCTVYEETPQLVYFPARREACSELAELDDCEVNKLIGKKLIAFYNTDSTRWETDGVVIEPDQMDFVRFCGPRQAIATCEFGGCPPEEFEGQPPDLNCCIFDGIARRDKPSCEYECGADNSQFDVWIICNDVNALPADEECFIARRIQDAYAVEYCPRGPNGGPTIVETRPVYSIGCCGCGCPRDRMCLEMWTTKVTQEEPPGGGDPYNVYESKDCSTSGQKICMKLERLPPQPGDLGGTVRYEGFFCQNHTVPRFVAQVQAPGDPYPTYIEPDCITGLAKSYWFNAADVDPDLCGDCYIETDSPFTTDPAHFQGCYDVIKEYVSGSVSGDDIESTDLWQTCRFCYRLEVVCYGGQGGSPNVQLKFYLCLPPGNPAYAGTPLEDPNAELVGLIETSDAEDATDLNDGCDGREWYKMSLGFGVTNPLLLLDDLGDPYIAPNTTFGFPTILHHVFGGCCYDHITLNPYGCIENADNNNCGCCHDTPAAIATCNYGVSCILEVHMKATWNCLNDIN